MKASTFLVVLLALHAVFIDRLDAATRSGPGKTYPFPIYTNQPAGPQLSGAHAAATTPALTPEQSQKQLLLPPGFEARLFAAEPEVVNPVAMTWDARGRLWVLELYEYPKGVAKGQKGRDRIKILEDTDADGRADKVTVFADGFSLATGLLLGNGGVYLGQAPDFLFLEDTNHDDKADKTTVLKTGFGLEDRHELLNGFAWGPDGWLYMTHGVFTYSTVRDPQQPDDDGVKMDAALARFHPVTKQIEVFADGTSNPWGVDWNERGDAFVSACVIMHLFHMAPGGQYNRQGGTWPNPYGYVRDLPSKGLPAIVDWRHYRAAHAGICIYAGNQYPAAWRGLVFIGNIHQNAINCNEVKPLGAAYQSVKESTLLGPDKGERAVGAGNFMVSQDPWFRPVSTQTGPDGALWVMDWYDKYPCYQNAQADPNGVDREHGRIWRVVWVGDQPGKSVPSRPSVDMDLAKATAQASGDQVAELLSHPNSWQRRTAQQLLQESKNPGLNEQLARWLNSDRSKVHESAPQSGAGSLPARLAAFWTLLARSNDGTELSGKLISDPAPAIRAWAARWIGAHGTTNWEPLARLCADTDVTVRAAAAAALRQKTSGALTIDTPPLVAVEAKELLPLFNALLQRPSIDPDTYYPHIVWLAMEPQVASNPSAFLSLLAAHENSLSAYCLRRAMRRISDLTEPAKRQTELNTAMVFLGSIASKTLLAEAAIDGLIEAQKSKGALPTVNLDPIFAQLTANAALKDKSKRLAAAFGDTSAAKMLMAKINDRAASADDRLKGIQIAREAKDDGARDELLKLIATERQDQGLLVEAVRAVTAVGGYEVAYNVVDAWSHFSPATKRAAAEVLVTRTKTARALLAGLDKKTVQPQDISATARRALARSEDATIVSQADRLLGRYRATEGDKLALIAAKRRVVLTGQADATAGYEVAKRACFVCHKMHGEGADVGPDLTGVGRSTLDALLHNVIDPNEIIGNGYENTEIELKDGSTLSGRVVEDTATRIKLVTAGPIEQTIAKSDIASAGGKLKIRKLEMSLMPEGLEQISDADFRNLIWYLLNPPQDNRPWSPALRRELLGEGNEPRAQK